MISLEFNTTPKEFAKAAITYIEKNSVVALLLFLMNTSCWISMLGYVLKFHGGADISAMDNLALLFAFTWLLFRRKLNIFILKRSFKKKNISDLTVRVTCDNNRISWYTTNNQRQHLPWNKISKIYKNKQGYIIPRIVNGPLNSTFIWIPKNGFKSEQDENNFLSILKTYNKNLSLKKIK